MGYLRSLIEACVPAGILLLLCCSTYGLVKTNGNETQKAPAQLLQLQQRQDNSRNGGGGLPDPVGSLVVSLSRVSDSYAEIAWRREPASSWKFEDPTSSLSACELAYGPLEDPYQVEVMSNFMPRGPTFTVGGLRHSATYHFHMVCYCCVDDHGDTDGNPQNGTSADSAVGAVSRLASNVLKFTTGTRSGSPQQVGVAGQGQGQSSWQQQDPYKGSYHSVYKQTILRDDDSNRAVPSFNVLLGALTGIVGFLIINVTVVIAVRRCSHRRMRRRRVLVLE